MIYLSGVVDKIPHEYWPGCFIGMMFTPQIANKPDMEGRYWAADTGCFTRPYDRSSYLRFLAGMDSYKNGNLFVTAPDVVGDWKSTERLAIPEEPILHALGWKVALVCQDGLKSYRVSWDRWDAIFIGGSTDWKLSSDAERLCREGKDRGLWVHMGRVNSQKRTLLAHSWGCDSVDGTYLAFKRRAGSRNNGIVNICTWLWACQRNSPTATTSYTRTR